MNIAAPTTRCCITWMPTGCLAQPKREDLDLDRMLETGAMVVEWAERIQAVLPPNRLWMKLRYIAEEQRGMVLLPEGSRYEKIVDGIPPPVLWRLTCCWQSIPQLNGLAWRCTTALR